MTALKSVLFGTAIGLLSAVGANAADFTPPAAPPIYIPPPTFTWGGSIFGRYRRLRKWLSKLR